MRIEAINGTRVAFHDGPVIASEADALDMLGATYGQDVDLIAVDVALLGDDFFKLRTGLAGAVLQKMQNYGARIAIVGDIERFTSQSVPLRNFVIESNRRGQTLFVPDLETLRARL
jgi:hypothetical protein